MSFYPDEMVRLEDAELFLMGASVADLGYEVMSEQLRHDIRAIKTVQDALRKPKVPPRFTNF